MPSNPYEAKINKLISTIKKTSAELSELACVVRVHTLSKEECLPFEDAIFYCNVCNAQLFNYSHLTSIKCIAAITLKLKYYFVVSDCYMAKASLNTQTLSCGEDFYGFHEVLCSCKNCIGIVVYDSTPAICSINECLLIDTGKVHYNTSTELTPLAPMLKLNSNEPNNFLQLAKASYDAFHLASSYLLPIHNSKPLPPMDK
jgi:hypothetical protein